MKLQILLISGGCLALLAFASLVHADPAKAEDDCYSMAVHYTARGFAMSPTNTSGVATSGFVVKVMIPITKGLDYVILVGRDKFARDIDLYVYDEDGQLILDDRRTDTRAGVKFRASYTGTVEAFVHMARAQGLAAYALLVGRRGIESAGAEPSTLGWEPTFQMGRSPTPAPEAPRLPVTSETAAPQTVSSVELVDQSLRELNWGSIAFNAPASMRYAQPQTVELLLSPSLSVVDLQAQLQQKVGVESARAQISNRMEAQLTGSGFAIEAQFPDLQAVTSQQTTRWTWKVTPTGHGPQTLHLTLSAHIDVAGRDAPLVVRTFDREIQVNITIPQRVFGFIQKNWQWLWAAIVVPIAGYLWKRKKKVPRAP